jgi:hypothetical protein
MTVLAHAQVLHGTPLWLAVVPGVLVALIVLVDRRAR